MQGKFFSKKSNRKVICILILFVMIYTMISALPLTQNKSYGATYTYSKTSNDLPANFDTLYPGYKTLIQNMVTNHPNWTFKLYETNQEWETVINSEYQGHGSSPKNLVPSSYSAAWICSICGTKGYDTSGRWYCASRAAIEHTMDPRNTINDTSIFQYLQLSNDKNITKEQVKTMASKISYLNDQKIIDGIYEVANNPDYNINPFYIIGKILQEQGSGANALCSGNGYKGQYVGYYNLFNVGASGNGTEQVILNGLAYAKSKGWDTPQKSIMGGIGLIRTYINRGQNTLYYQKFNVVYSPYYSNQYAQNILDSQSIGTILKGYYKDAGLLDSSFTFIIPLYKNMPKNAVPTPALSSETGEIAHINASGGLALRASPNGTTIAYVNEGTQVIILERAKEKIEGYYWDKVSTPKGTGYMAREAKDGSKVYLVVEGKEPEQEPEKPSDKYIIDNTNILITPETVISDIDGATTSDTTFGTGAKIKIKDKEYSLVMIGDINGDGKIKASDYVLIKNFIMTPETSKLNDLQKKAADINKDSSIKASDYVLIKNYIMYGNKISL